MHGVGRDQPVQVFCTSVIRVQVVLVVLGGPLQQLGVSFPEELLQPRGVDVTGGHGCTGDPRHGQPISEFGDGQHVLTGQNWLQGGQRVGGFVGQLTIIQT